MNLPIDVVSGTKPPKFRWSQTLSTPAGLRTVEHVACLPPTVEAAVEALIFMAKEQAQEITNLRKRAETAEKRLEGSMEVLAAQSKKLGYNPIVVQDE